MVDGLDPLCMNRGALMLQIFRSSAANLRFHPDPESFRDSGVDVGKSWHGRDENYFLSDSKSLRKFKKPSQLKY